jgi:hypothetical protein
MRSLAPPTHCRSRTPIYPVFPTYTPKTVRLKNLPYKINNMRCYNQPNFTNSAIHFFIFGVLHYLYRTALQSTHSEH